MWSYWLKLNKLTDSEVCLEPAIAGLGERYRVQYFFPSLKHFADFALLDRKRIIEVDGSSHDKPSQKKKDLERMIALRSMGWDVIRVTNESAQASPEETVLTALKAEPTPLEELQSALGRLQRDYPKLWEPKKRRARKASRKRGAGRRKRPA